MLFELGYRINLRWLGTNPWLGAAGLPEALLNLRRGVIACGRAPMSFRQAGRG